MTTESIDAQTTQPQGTRRRTTIFRAQEAKEVSGEMMPAAGVTDVVINGLQRATDSGYGEGATVRLLFADEGANVSLTYSWFKANLPLPIHSHDAECTYYIISGELRMGTEVLKAGDGFHVPAGARYSYVAGETGLEVLEFRTATHFNIDFSGASAAQFQRMADVAVANAGRWKEQGRTPPLAVQRFTASGDHWLADKH